MTQLAGIKVLEATGRGLKNVLIVMFQMKLNIPKPTLVLLRCPPPRATLEDVLGPSTRDACGPPLPLTVRSRRAVDWPHSALAIDSPLPVNKGLINLDSFSLIPTVDMDTHLFDDTLHGVDVGVDLTQLLDVAHLLLQQHLHLPTVLGQALFFCISVFHLPDDFHLHFLQMNRLGAERKLTSIYCYHL